MLWIKAFHIISVVCWFAMLFYLPRLFVYHAKTDNQAIKDQFKIMERRLYWGIGLPSMLLTLVFGFWTAAYAWQYNLTSGWFHIKLALVIILVIYHHICGRFLKQFRTDSCHRSHQFFRWFNEIPTVILIGAVLLVVFKYPL